MMHIPHVKVDPVVGISIRAAPSLKELKSDIAEAFLNVEPHFSASLRIQLKSPAMIHGREGWKQSKSSHSCLLEFRSFAPYTIVM